MRSLKFGVRENDPGMFPFSMHVWQPTFRNTVFHLSVTLKALSEPFMAFAAFFIPCKSTRTIKILFVVAMGFVALILATAIESPNTLAGQYWGGSLTVVSWVAYGCLLTYVKVFIAQRCRQISKSALYWYGVVNQVMCMVFQTKF